MTENLDVKIFGQGQMMPEPSSLRSSSPPCRAVGWAYMGWSRIGALKGTNSFTERPCTHRTVLQGLGLIRCVDARGIRTLMPQIRAQA